VNVDFKKSFLRDLKKIKNKDLLQEVKEAIEDVEKAQNFQMVSNLKQLKGRGGYFRIRIDDYRIDMKLEGDFLFSYDFSIERISINIFPNTVARFGIYQFHTLFI